MSNTYRFWLPKDAELERTQAVVNHLFSLTRIGAVKGEVTEWKDTRSNEQNKRMWAMLRDVSKQVEWYGRYLTKEDWKDIFTAALKKHEVVPGIDGGFVVLGTRTRNLTIAQMSDLMELMSAFGAEHGVEWTEARSYAA